MNLSRENNLRNNTLNPMSLKIIDHEQAGIRGKVSIVKIHFKAAISFKKMMYKISIKSPSLMVCFELRHLNFRVDRALFSPDQ